MSKSLRIIHVLEILQKLGRASPKEIQEKVALRMSKEAGDASFMRTIYRDLKELTDQGRLKAYYFSPDGAPLDSVDEDSLKNVRIEYGIAAPGAEDNISGGNLLESAGVNFITSKEMRPLWKARHIHSEFDLEKHFTILIQESTRLTLALQTSLEDIPCRIIIGRNSEPFLDRATCLKTIKESHGLRASYLFSDNPSISRFVPGQKLGHCLISVDRNGKIGLQDLGSTSGTSFGSIAPENLKEVWRKSNSDMTAPAQSPTLPTELVKVSHVETKLAASTCLLKLGTLNVILAVSN
ncbi:MAG: hypothetical protein V4736_06340 [Bdellovibrionota bacterium]